MLWDLPGKKSQLDLRPFGVGVPRVCRTVMPWLWFPTEASPKSVSYGNALAVVSHRGK